MTPPRSRPPLLVRLAIGAVRTVEFLALSSLGAVGAFVAFAHHSRVQTETIGRVVPAAEAALGERIHLGAFEIGLLPLRFGVRDLALIHPATGDTFLSLRSADVYPGWCGERPRLCRINLDGLAVDLHMEADGRLRELRDVNLPKKPPSEVKPPVDLPIWSLSMTPADVTLALADGGTVRATGVSLTPRRGGASDFAADVEVETPKLKRGWSLRWPEVRVGPDSIGLPSVVIEDPIATLRAAAAVDLRSGEVRAAGTFDADLAEVTPLLQPPASLTGLVHLDLEVLGPPETIAAEILADIQGLSVTTKGFSVPTSTKTFGDATVDLLATPDAVDIRSLRWPWGPGLVTADGRIDLKNMRLTDATVTGRDLSLEHILRTMGAAPTPWVDMKANADIRVSGSLKPLRLTGPYSLDTRHLIVADRPVKRRDRVEVLHLPNAEARGELVLEAKHILLGIDEITGPRTVGTGEVDIGFGPLGPLRVDADFHHAVLEDFGPLGDARLAGTGRLMGHLAGPFNHLSFEGTGDFTGFSAVGVPWADHLIAKVRSPEMKSIVLEEAVATRGATTYTGDVAIDFRSPLSLTADLEIEDGHIRDLIGMFLDIEGVDALVDGDLHLAGPLYHLNGRSELAFADADLYGERFELGAATGYMDDGLFHLDDLLLHRNNGVEALLARGTVGRAWALNGEILASGFDLGRLDHLADAGLPVRGDLSAWVHLGNTLMEPAPDGRITLVDTRYESSPLENSLIQFTTTNGTLSFGGNVAGDSLALSGSQGLWGDQPYEIEATFHDLPLHVAHPRAVDGGPIKATLTGDVALSGQFGDAPTPVDLLAHVSRASLSWGRHQLTNPRPWTFRQQGSDFAIESFSVAGGRTRFDLSGTGSDPLMLRGNGTLDLDLLRAVVPGLTFAEGLADAAVRVTGTAPDVETVVDVAVRDGRLTHTSVPADFEDVSGSFKATADGITVEDVTGHVGGGDLTLSGTVDANRWIPSRYDLDLDVDGAEIQWIPELAPARGNAELSFDGPADALLLSGEVDIEDMAFVERIDWEDSVVSFRDELTVDPGAVLEKGLFDLNIQIDAPRTIRLGNNVAEGVASGTFTVIGDTNRPGLLGQVRIEEGNVFLEDRAFEVRRGVVEFDDPWSWDPALDFSLFTRVRHSDRDYGIEYRVFDRFSDWNTSVRSDPALPQSDVNALLWFGVTTGELEEIGLPQAIVQSVADLLLNDLLANTGAKDLRGQLFVFDRLELVTGVTPRGDFSPDPRLALTKRIDALDGLTLRGEINLLRPSDQYYRLEKQLSRTWTLSGWYATLQRERVLDIGGAYGVDLSARWEQR